MHRLAELAHKALHAEHIDRLVWRIQDLRDRHKGQDRDMRYSISILLEIELRKAMLTPASEWARTHMLDQEISTIIKNIEEAGLERAITGIEEDVQKTHEKARKFLLEE